ncbi:hypothetical protein MNBD_BACTEROID07-610 [hydrothermal vent metagenome]|uniref:Uracil-DNA glycosylase-like domain-containing protein n=1 Tax=hydrothermal vent metagenome TaxID=652676 RepID=A0A3B0UCH1_9ZZZZ
MTFAEKTLMFYRQLAPDKKMPDGVEILNPYSRPETMAACEAFYTKFYNDHKNRRIIFGINPGRFGAGVTGIPFTDPIRLEKACGIPNNFDKKAELSSQFIYLLIENMGGVSPFYQHYFIGAISPLGFVKNGKNFNYYDDRLLERSLKSFIIKNMVRQVALGINTDKCFCLGNGKNYIYLQRLNDELKIFNEIIPLPHPRWVMQYRRKQLQNFLGEISRRLSI